MHPNHIIASRGKSLYFPYNDYTPRHEYKYNNIILMPYNTNYVRNREGRRGGTLLRSQGGPSGGRIIISGYA